MLALPLLLPIVLSPLSGVDLHELREGKELVIRATVPDISVCKQGIPLNVVEGASP